MGRWQVVFLLAAFILFNTGMVFICFSKSELQPWNNLDNDIKKQESELMLIKKKDKKIEKNGA